MSDQDSTKSKSQKPPKAFTNYGNNYVAMSMEDQAKEDIKRNKLDEDYQAAILQSKTSIALADDSFNLKTMSVDNANRYQSDLQHQITNITTLTKFLVGVTITPQEVTELRNFTKTSVAQINKMLNKLNDFVVQNTPPPTRNPEVNPNITTRKVTFHDYITQEVEEELHPLAEEVKAEEEEEVHLTFNQLQE